jgi:hypothetical protein
MDEYFILIQCEGIFVYIEVSNMFLINSQYSIDDNYVFIIKIYYDKYIMSIPLSISCGCKASWDMVTQESQYGVEVTSVEKCATHTTSTGTYYYKSCGCYMTVEGDIVTSLITCVDCTPPPTHAIPSVQPGDVTLTLFCGCIVYYTPGSIPWVRIYESTSCNKHLPLDLYSRELNLDCGCQRWSYLNRDPAAPISYVLRAKSPICPTFH